MKVTINTQETNRMYPNSKKDSISQPTEYIIYADTQKSIIIIMWLESRYLQIITYIHNKI